VRGSIATISDIGVGVRSSDVSVDGSEMIRCCESYVGASKLAIFSSGKCG